MSPCGLVSVQAMNNIVGIPTPKFSIAVTFLSGVIATVLGVVASLFTEQHPMYFVGAEQLLLSWSGRELGQGLTCLIAALFVRDARVIGIVLLSSWVRELIDFIDFFRLSGTPLRLYFVVGISTLLHSWALVLVVRQIQSHLRT